MTITIKPGDLSTSGLLRVAELVQAELTAALKLHDMSTLPEKRKRFRDHAIEMHHVASLFRRLAEQQPNTGD